MTNCYNIIVQDAAQNDLHGIWGYLANALKNPVAAANILDKLHKAILSLSELPERYTLLNDTLLKRKGIRKIPVENYIIFYHVNEQEKTVSILRILYGKRDWEHIL